MMSVSVVITSYNYASFVVDAIESVLAQTTPPTEIIVVDDGSTDKTPIILEERYSQHPLIKLIRQRNQGQLAAFVSGLEQASGDIVCFLDADDKFEPCHIENLTRAFAKNKDIDFIFTAHRLFGDSDQVVQYAPQDLMLGFSLIVTLKCQLYIGSVTSTVALRRDLVLTLLPVLRHATPRWRIRADDCLVYGASLAGCKKYYLATPSVLYRVHGANNYFQRKESRDEQYSHGLRRDTLTQLFADHVGLGPHVRLRLVMEFLSIERPTREVYNLYCDLNHEINKPLFRRLKERIKLYRHYHRHKATWDLPS